ncbi:latex clearing protein [Aspergillus udagawae]|uniref:Latex clearing protein n=1 Tax=Aspergillus udagawae TaxID=91492 RepID=A0ABQ1AGJ3_9EURO|nr:latex clearing protein [Aspergillus udagawae]
MISSNHEAQDVCNYWGHKFEWTDLHRSAEQLHTTKNEESTSTPAKRDLYVLLEKHHDDDLKIKEFWDEINTVPDWVDWEQINRAQEVFYRYGMPVLNVLTFQSLLGGMGSGRVVETLARTGGFSADVARRRMLETLQHVLQVVGSVDAMRPGGAGHASSVRVRLLHAAVRSRILHLVKNKPEYYDVDTFGIPINDLDCIATINTFSTSVIWIGLPRQGILLREREIDDYLALWRLVAYHMGTPHEFLETRAKGKAMMESLLASEIDPTDMSKILAQNIILSLENTAPTYASKEFMEAMVRHLNGKQLSDELNIPRPNLYYQALVYGYCVVVMWFAYTFRLFRPIDQAMIKVRMRVVLLSQAVDYLCADESQFRRRKYYKIINDKDEGLGGETFFEFKYVPFYTRTTRLGKRKSSKRIKRGVEYLALMGLLFAVVAAGTLLGSILHLLNRIHRS